jgi:hypothetical protein
MRLFIIPVALIFCASCSSSNNEHAAIPNEDSLITGNSNRIDSTATVATPSYSFEVFETAGLGWGYKIFDNGTLFINQPHIPAIQGNKGFSSKEKAEITANFAILKMEQGFVPPTISPEELDSLGVLN